MNMDTICLQTRRELTADPNNISSELTQHLSNCEQCSGYIQKLRLFDNKLKSAFNIDVPESLESRIILAQRMDNNPESAASNVIPIKKDRSNHEYKWISLAAALVLAVGLSLGIFKLGESHGIQEEVLAHVYEHQDALKEDKNVNLTSFNALLEPYGAHADESIGHIRYANNCPLKNKKAPHFVLSEDGAPVTVMYIPWQEKSKRVAIDDDRFKGIIFNSEKGSFVILSEDPDTIDRVEDRITASIETRI